MSIPTLTVSSFQCDFKSSIVFGHSCYMQDFEYHCVHAITASWIDAY